MLRIWPVGGHGIMVKTASLRSRNAESLEVRQYLLFSLFLLNCHNCIDTAIMTLHEILQLEKDFV